MKKTDQTMITKNKNVYFEECIEAIKNSDNIFLASHIHPDGDNIGSLLALGMALKTFNKNVNIIKVDDIPKDYLFLPNIDLFVEPNPKDPIDLFISLDCSDLDRLGIGKELAIKANRLINIDHHITNENFGDINIVDPFASATGELVYHLIKKIGIEINKDIATCIYVAISTDTGSFMYDSTTSETHMIAADLISKGINTNNIIVNLYQSRSIERTKLFLKTLNTLEVIFNGKVAFVMLTQDMLKECNANMEDSEGIISFVRDIEGIEVACILKEYKENEIKLSLRSKNIVDVSEICFKFNGGGHKRAAGCTIFDNIKNVKNIISDEIYKYFR
ncbi:DHH family phosphoesterase [Anaerosalibacter sp. Marseille-P3206]|uniref:DHH family phosphoesterase n=1 Tax=Anaerosalibacter sp. Marseille-P3206 TaxID=1871005 RepID=UPI001F219347|nr:bifunctional oligoribonuclease/PAP phosphatase NrnA [Anaerosalibacter sp. Marseille-P3206]